MWITPKGEINIRERWGKGNWSVTDQKHSSLILVWRNCLKLIKGLRSHQTRGDLRRHDDLVPRGTLQWILAH